MGNLKKFLSNKNIVTLLGAVLIVVVLFLFYKWRVNTATQPVSIPYALHAIEPLSQITLEDVGIVEVPQTSLQGNIISNPNDVYNRYSAYFIPSGGLFYSSSKEERGGNVANYDDLPASYLYNLNEGDIAFNMDVNIESTYGNSFFPGKYFDVYLRITPNQDKKDIIFGRFITNVKILAVRDGGGLDVFATSEELRMPSQIIFGVNEEINAYLRVAEKLTSVEIILVPTAIDRKYEGADVPATQMVNSELQEYLEPYLNHVLSDNASTN